MIKFPIKHPLTGQEKDERPVVVSKWHEANKAVFDYLNEISKQALHTNMHSTYYQRFGGVNFDVTVGFDDGKQFSFQNQFQTLNRNVDLQRSVRHWMDFERNGSKQLVESYKRNVSGAVESLQKFAQMDAQYDFGEHSKVAVRNVLILGGDSVASGKKTELKTFDEANNYVKGLQLLAGGRHAEGTTFKLDYAVVFDNSETYPARFKEDPACIATFHVSPDQWKGNCIAQDILSKANTYLGQNPSNRELALRKCFDADGKKAEYFRNLLQNYSFDRQTDLQAPPARKREEDLQLAI
ncbi:hypothetical protein ACQU0X_27040 [Pseudovibrio ascidiaceicola]|uniref:hypothetical protein n=1 Tax=Pseudovibrio ascidiaceicola TaxID=285279 RepID=UPI003D3697C7